jgi:nucleoside-diphosphate-sugar epimerase
VKNRVAADAVRMIAGMAETIGNILNVKPWVTRELLAGSGMTYYFSCDKARRELGYEITPFKDAVKRTFEWYKEHGLL